MPAVVIQLPVNFTPHHEAIVIRYLTGQLHGQEEWRLATVAFTLLDDAMVTTADHTYTFRQFYQHLVDEQLSDAYLRALFRLSDVSQQSPPLWASFARQIVQAFTRLQWQAREQTVIQLCLSYLLYWWNAFARGYAFEVEVFQDLQRAGIHFQAHNLLDHNQRFSPSDLTVIGQAGDIKTSTYFLHIVPVARHDFYIVRFASRGRTYTVVVMLQPTAWDVINGDTVDGDLASVLQQLPLPVRVQSNNYEFVMIAYNEWKRRILRRQGKIP